MCRIFLDGLDDTCYGELKARIENSFAEGTDIYRTDVAYTLTRAQNYVISKKPFARNRDALAFTTAGGPMGEDQRTVVVSVVDT